MNKNKVIELWKTDCEDCEAARPIVEELEKEGYEFEKHNIHEPDGSKLWNDFAGEIDKYSQSQGWETGYIYTPTFIRPDTRRILAFSDRPPTKEELINFAAEN